MTIREIEAQSGMTRANIRYYEREGLLSPHREFNGYRDYSESDLATLKRIKLLRRLNVSLEEIKSLQSGTIELGEILSQKIGSFEQAEQEAAFAQQVCRTMQSDGVAYRNLDAQKYLDAIPESTFEPGFFTLREPRSADLGQVAHPWRRFLARTLDIFFYETLWLVFLSLAFRTNLGATAQSRLAVFFHLSVALAMMVIVEPLLLNLFGTTLGKWVFGLHIEDKAGGRPSYYLGFVRTWDVLHFGLGFNIPIYELVTLWRSFKRCENWEPQPWDGDLVLTIRDTKWYRGVAYAVAYALVFAILVAGGLAARIPPHRGELTVAEFAENYNTLADYFNVPYNRLNAAGQWTTNRVGSTEYIGVDTVPRQNIEYTLDNDRIKGIRWLASVSGSDEIILARDLEIGLAAQAFIGAQPGFSLFTMPRYDVFKLVANRGFTDFSVTWAGVAISHTVEHSGYIVAGYDKALIPIKQQPTRFQERFAMEKAA